MPRPVSMLAALYALALSSGCAVSSAQTSTAPSAVVRMNPSHFADVTSISGYLRFNSHARQLWDDVAALRENEASKCVTLINTSPFETALRNLNNSYIEVEGFPVGDVLSGQVDFGACNRVGFYVRSVRSSTRNSGGNSGNSSDSIAISDD